MTLAPAHIHAHVPQPRTDAATAPSAPATQAGNAAAGPGWRLLDETTATDAIVDAIAGARQVVNAEFFGITDAGKGARLTTALEGAARRGVEVNVIADFMSAITPPVLAFQRMRARIEEAGGSVVVTSRIPLSPRATANPALRHVDHRKVVTVDGDVGFVGGMNFLPLSDDYHDTMVRLDGVAAARLAADQLDRWGRVSGTVTDRHRASVDDALAGRSRIATDRRELGIVANAPEQGRFEVSDAYREMIRGARERLWISSPVFADREVIADVRAAAARGVDVRLIAPGSPPIGVPIFNWVGRAHLGGIVEQGGTAYEIPEVLHRKAVIADDEVVLSSYNLTARSRSHDHEVGIRTADPAFVEAIADVLRGDMARGTRLDRDALTGLRARIGAFIARNFSY